MKIESTHSIEITDFVEQAQINPKFFYKPYFLEPQKGGEKSYTLLHRALSNIGRIGIAKVAISSREYLAAVKPDGLFLILELMHFAHEVLEPESLTSAGDREVAPKELEMAKKLIDAMTSEWEPTKYKDQYQTAVMEMIEAKAKKLPTKGKQQAPKPPTNRSLPVPPDRLSLPEPPHSLSAPEPPLSVSFPAIPETASSPRPPNRVLLLVDPFR